MTIEQWHAKTLSKNTYSGNSFNSAEKLFDGFVLDRLPSEDAIQKWHNLLIKYLTDNETNTYFIRKYESTKSNGDWDNRRGAVVSFDKNNIEIVYSSNNLAHEVFLMARDGFVPTYEDFVNAIKDRSLIITSGTKIEKEIRTYHGSNKRCEGYLAHLFDVNGDYYDSVSEKINFDNNTLYPKGKKEDWSNSKDRIFHIKDYSLDANHVRIIKAHMLRFLDPINYFVMPKNNEQRINKSLVTINYGENDDFLNYVKSRYSKMFNGFKSQHSNTDIFTEFQQLALTNYTPKQQENYNVDFVYWNEEVTHKEYLSELKHLVDPTVLNAYSKAYEYIKSCDLQCPNCSVCGEAKAIYTLYLSDSKHDLSIPFETLYKQEQEYLQNVVLA